MAKYNSSAFGNISGEVLGVVASSNKGINFIKNKAKVTDSKTEKQLARRAIYERFCKLWDEKKYNLTVQNYKVAGLEKDVFKNTLGFTLKHSENASLLWLTTCPTKGTMSAPVFIKTDFEVAANKSIKLTGVFLFPAFDENGVFEMYSGYFGQDIYGYDQLKTSFAVYYQAQITSREIPFSARTPSLTQSVLLGQKVFRSYWYVNKKTGQVSKPICIAIDESGNVETFYPFGK
jgi:hypothetical protein